MLTGLSRKCTTTQCMLYKKMNSVKNGGENTLITEDIAYAPGRSLSVVKVPRNLKKTALYSTLCAQRTDAFYLFDLDWLLESHELWKKNMANIRPYYAVRASLHPAIIKVYASLGCGFDCASKGEIESVLSTGVDPADIVYANPFKAPEYIEYAAAHGVHLYTFDSESELQKVASIDPSAKLLVRLAVDNPLSKRLMNNKYGVPVKKACQLLRSAKDLGAVVVGVCFHVGDCVEPLVYKDALERGCEVFDYARDELGLALTVMDIGGGFEGFEHLQGRFERTSAVVSAAVKTVFAAYPNVTVFAEPGRLFARRTSILLTRVIGKRWITNEEGKEEVVYCLNDGEYSSFVSWDSPSEIFKEMLPVVLKSHKPHEPRYTSTLYGQSCSPMDVIVEDIELPELEMGEWLFFPSMGAYLCPTKFNGFPLPQTVYTVSEDQLETLKEHFNTSLPPRD